MVRKNRSLSKIFIFIFLGAFIAYGVFESLRFWSGPKITISEPKNGSEIATSTVILLGKVKNISYLTLNDRQIFADTEGNFGQKLLLQEGYNIITIEARDRFGKEKSKTLELYRTIELEEIFEESEATDESATSTESLKEEEETATTIISN